ncbi:MAG: AsmA family protein [Candidatus Rokuibacteriota bacterium]
MNPRRTKFLLLGLVLVVVLAVAIVAIALRSLDLRRVADVVGERVKAATGREFAIKGPLRVRLFPTLAIAASDVHIGNAPWGSRPDMLRLRRAEAEIAFWPLLRGRVEIRRFVLVGPDLLLETDQAGSGNWVLQPPGEKPADDSPTTGGAPAIGLDQLRVEDARIAYRDGKTGRETRIDVPQLAIDGAGDATRIAGALSLRGQRVRVEATTSRLEALAAGAAAVPIDLVATVDGATAAVKGTVSQAGQVDVTVTGEVTTTAGLSRLADTSLNVPLPLKTSARVRGGGDVYVLDPLDLTVAGQAIGGRAAIKLAGARPAFDVSMASPSLDLARLMPGTDTRPQPAPPRSSRRWLFGEEPLPLDGLGLVDARVEARVERLVLPNAVPLQAVHLVLVARDRKLEVSPLAFTLARGPVTGKIALDAAGSGAPRLKTKLDGAGIRLEELAAATGRTGQVSGGETSVAVDLGGAGSSLRRLAATASGIVQIVVGPAQLAATALDIGGDTLTKLLDIVNPFRKSDATTELRCAVVRLPLRDGVAKIERSVAYETSKITMVMAGLVDLREETLDLAIRPSVTQGLRIGVANLAELVRVTGPLMEPHIGLDTMGAARQAASIGAAVATGGLSLLGEAVLKGAIDPHPCQSALAAGPPVSTGASKPDKSGPVKGFIRGLLK